MDNLAFSNVLYRKTRTVLSSVGVALGVVLVVMTVGLVHGFLKDQGDRNGAVTAEIMFNSPGSTFGLDLSPSLSMPVSLADDLKRIPGVADAVPVGHYVKGRLIDGIDYDEFTQVSGIKIVEGRALQSGDEAIVDTKEQYRHKLKIGDSIEVFDRSFKLVGVYQPESLGRVKIPIETMQRILNLPGLCSMIFVKVSDPSKTDEVVERI
ncbi:MAG: ABC transporter permease, partial [Blastocatellia bacterium]